MNVPGFLVRQFYVAGSLRNTGDGFTLQARNPMGDGALVGVGQLKVDGVTIPASAVTAVRESDSQQFRASDVTRQRPIEIRQGDRITLSVAGARLAAGNHRLEVELTEQNLGSLRLSITDRLR